MTKKMRAANFSFSTLCTVYVHRYIENFKKCKSVSFTFSIEKEWIWINFETYDNVISV